MGSERLQLRSPCQHRNYFERLHPGSFHGQAGGGIDSGQRTMEDVNGIRIGTLWESGILAQVLKKLAGTTGLEPATSCVTGMRSNQLNYVPIKAVPSDQW